MFKVLKSSKRSRARAGILQTPHGDIETPAFVPVATQAALKGLLPSQAAQALTQILMVNTYHLWVRQADTIIKKAGGLHHFMNWDKPLMTDSGGFQVFSLGWGYGKEVSKIMKEADSNFLDGRSKSDDGLVTIDEEGVVFRSHLDGSLKRLTPKESIRIQERLGADIIFAFDECTSPDATHDYTTQALQRTHRWAKESVKARKRSDQLLFGIVQGGRYQDLREESARYIGDLAFDGFGIGGGFKKEDIPSILEWSIAPLPPKKPRHFLGIGEIEDIYEGVRHGVDLFDCVIPTRLARHGVLITKTGRVTMANRAWQKDMRLPDKDCACFTCAHFLRAYLSHVSRAGEMIAITLAMNHNIYFYNSLMKAVRDDIFNDNL